MKVRLINYTTPSKELFEQSHIVNLEELVAYTARVSNPSNQANLETSNKLIKYLIRNKHWSVFEMVSVTLEIETTRDIARQMLRHRSFSFQEFSQRYANPVDELALVTREGRKQDSKNRQNSIEIDMTNRKDKELEDEWQRQQKDIISKVLDTYKWAVRVGIAKEQARAILPEGLTMSRLYMHGTLRSWIHYIELRTGNGTQKEHRQVAAECANVIEKIFPMIFEVLHE